MTPRRPSEREGSGGRPHRRLVLGCSLAVGLALGLSFSPPLRAQPIPVDHPLAASFTGQFLITGTAEKSPLMARPEVYTDTNLVHLDPAVLSVSAERIKKVFCQLIGLEPRRGWRGKIVLELHEAARVDETVNVIARPMGDDWSYLVQLPNVVAADRYLRGLTGALLLEAANRVPAEDGRCAEVPAWLIDGLAGQMHQDELADVLACSTGEPDVPALKRPQDLDPLAKARHVLRKNRVLTYTELCWPTDAQLAGADGGVFYASSQLFVTELLQLNDGPARLRQMLATLSRCQNWQTAFQAAFQGHFARPLDVEKWWALTTVEFLSHERGPVWTPRYSAELLDQLVSVPVEIRLATNSLPSHQDLPLQSVLRKFTPERQMAIYQARLNDLRFAELRMSPEFNLLANGYCHALAGYLGVRLEPPPRPAMVRKPDPPIIHLTARNFAKQLDALDARRRRLEAAIPPETAQN